MFQCIVNVSCTKGLKDMVQHLIKNNVEHKLFAPGRLGRIIIDTQKYQIGSISIKVKIADNNVSVLLFNTHKLKVSGGIKVYESSSLNSVYMDDYMKSVYLTPIIKTIYGREETFELNQSRFNAILYRANSIGKKNFIEFIEKIKEVFRRDHIIMPDIMRTDGNQRGRICALKVKFNSGKGVFAIDHSGNVQFFAYTNVEDLQKHKSELMKVWL